MLLQIHLTQMMIHHSLEYKISNSLDITSYSENRLLERFIAMIFLDLEESHHCHHRMLLISYKFRGLEHGDLTRCNCVRKDHYFETVQILCHHGAGPPWNPPYNQLLFPWLCSPMTALSAVIAIAPWAHIPRRAGNAGGCDAIDFILLNGLELKYEGVIQAGLGSVERSRNLKG